MKLKLIKNSIFIPVAIIAFVIAIIVGFSYWNFKMQVNEELNKILTQNQVAETKIINKNMLSPLPKIVQKWLENSGVVGKEKTKTIYLKQKGLIRLNPEENWSKAEAEQYITTESPAFLWRVKLSMMPLIDVFGRDYFINGKGQMKMKVASLLTVVDVKNNEKVNQATLQRYLAEIIWYPSAAISPYISWESIDEYSAKANMSYKGVAGSVTFHFDENGDIKKISALRYKGSDKQAELKEWLGEIKEYSIVNGVKIPTKVDLSWILSGKKFTWYKIKITDINYNNI